jgi:formamidopyrimidine-DNA glycosylase
VLIDCDLDNSKLLKGLGPEADRLSFDEFIEILKKSRLGRIKPLLMDQKKIAGIGNAYVDEILWKSKIHPNKTASLLTDAQIKTLYGNISEVLKWGVEESTKDVGEELAESERSWMNVYRKKGKPCPVCRTSIEQIKVVGRDTFYCRKCQKE